MNPRLSLAALLLVTPICAHGQRELLPTQTVLLTEAKAPVNLTAANVSLEVDGHTQPISALNPVNSNDVQIALLIDDGLRTSIGRQMSDIKSFIQKLPQGTEILIGYMQNGRVVTATPFTRDHAAAAASLRLPLGSPGLSASPYFCLSDFSKHWPTEPSTYGPPAAGPARKSRFVIMLTNGVDPYNGSTSVMNQDSPYVQSAISDAQRAGVSVSSIYYGDAGIRGGSASFSGQSYLAQVAEATGGIAFYQGIGNPVSLLPYFDQFLTSLSRSYLATFDVPAGKDLVRVKFRTHSSGAKLHAPDAVHPGRAMPPAA